MMALYHLQTYTQGVSEPTFIFLGVAALLSTGYYFKNTFDTGSSLVISTVNLVLWGTWSFSALDVRATQSFCCQPNAYRYSNLAFLGLIGAALFAVFLLRDILDVVEQRA